jgi:hypothetical protein
MSLSGNRLSTALCAAVSALLSAGAADAPTPAGRFFTNSLGMEFVRVDPGTFTMGANTDPRLADTGGFSYDEQPAHQVALTRPFYILKSKISQADFQRSSLGESAAEAGVGRDAFHRVPDISRVGDAVERVPIRCYLGSWNDGAAFCAWLSRREGRAYRLPTEAEWEYLCKKAQRGAGAGAGDFAGREWVQDWHGLYPFDPVTDPIGPASGLTKVIRDGPKRASLSPDASGQPWGLDAAGFRVVLVTEPPANPFVTPPPFTQAAIKQSTAPARLGPDPKIPYFVTRFALPIPPDDDTNLAGPLTGLDQSVMSHNHSPGFEILPNGDALAIFFSARDTRGGSESDPGTRFVQARLRYGTEQWDPPELFCDFKPLNDQSGLLWTEGNSVRFFGGGRGANSALLPFKVAVSTNNGATWTMTLPLLDAPANDCTPQPIVNAFRAPDKAMYFAMDGSGDQSFLWRSADNGIHWHDMGGRTGGRHSTIVPLDGKGNLLCIGGKSTSINGCSPRSVSSDWGATWSPASASPFPALGSNQRPCLIRLANGHLCFVSDSYKRKEDSSPHGSAYGEGCFVAVSADNGETWRIKRLPVELPHIGDRNHGTLGYATARQAPNGVIHVLATMTHPCLHYEFNEAWVMSDSGAIEPDRASGPVRTFTEKYPGGATRAVWGARATTTGRYLLFGTETTFYKSGAKEHEVTYINGLKIGEETFWADDGTKIWSWTHDPERNTSTWVHYWDNGHKRIESHWSTKPRARDIDRRFFGLVADGPASHWNRDGSPAQAYNFTNGTLAGTVPLAAANNPSKRAE